SLAVVRAAARGYPQAEDGLLAAVVHERTEDEARGVARTVDRPARERARHLGDVLLRVAAVDAERVQLHQLARVVLVEAGALAAIGPEPRREVRSRAEPVVEVKEHRGMRRRPTEQVTEPAERVGPDDVALVGREV